MSEPAGNIGIDGYAKSEVVNSARVDDRNGDSKDTPGGSYWFLSLFQRRGRASGVNHGTIDAVSLEADNGSRGCRTPHERALPFKYRSRLLLRARLMWKLGNERLKTRVNWMRVVVADEESGVVVLRYSMDGKSVV